MQMDEEVMTDEGPSSHCEPPYSEGMCGEKNVNAYCYDHVSMRQCIPHVSRVMGGGVVSHCCTVLLLFICRNVITSQHAAMLENAK